MTEGEIPKEFTIWLRLRSCCFSPRQWQIMRSSKCCRIEGLLLLGAVALRLGMAGLPSLNIGESPDANAPCVDGKGRGRKIGFVQDQIADAARRVAPATREVGCSEIAGLVHALCPFFARRMAGDKIAFRLRNA